MDKVAKQKNAKYADDELHVVFVGGLAANKILKDRAI